MELRRLSRGQVWWDTPLTLTLWRCRQSDCYKFQTRLGSVVRPCL